MKTELLSPAGDIEAAYSAFYFGADAIYLGLRRFSARAEAINFSPEELDEITAFAHAHQKKVYVALNTLMQENELPELMSHLQMCANCHVDALIVQDIGVARIIKKTFPELTLHASTQMAIHNLAGALALKKIGFERVVLARELSLNEIKHIQEKSGLEVEVFIHGALCYSYSGLCYFSSMTTGRSANRGKCVYSCRSMFKLNDKQYHPFSMKDFALEKDVCQLSGLSLKIEGRKKNALYVGAVTDYYRRILDTGKTDVSLSDNLKQIFARPWTKLHFNKKNKDVIEPNFVGHRGLFIGKIDKIFNGQISFCPTSALARYDGIQIDVDGLEKPFGFSVEKIISNGKPVFEVSPHQFVSIPLPNNAPFIKKGSSVYLASSTRVKGTYTYTRPKKGLYKNLLPIDVSIYIEQTQITAVADGISVTLSEAFPVAQQIEKVSLSIQNCFDKTGDTSFHVNSLMIQNPHQLFVPMSILNELRRQLFKELTQQLIRQKQTPTLPNTHFKIKHATPKWRLKTDDISILNGVDLSPIDELIIEISTRTKPTDLTFLPTDKIRLSCPSILRHTDFQSTIQLFWQAGYHKWQITNWSGLTLLPKDADIDFDYTIPVLNSQAGAMMFENNASGITFSVEDTYDNIHCLSQKMSDTTVIVYQDTPLFLSANCIRPNDCTNCSHQPERYTLSNGRDLLQAISKDCLTTVFKNEPFYIGDMVDDLSVTWLRMDFCYRQYSAQQLNNLIRKIQKGEKLTRRYTGNFKKKFA